MSRPHLAVPLRIRGGRAVTVEEDTAAHRLQQAGVLLNTRLDSRPAFPGYGIPDMTQMTTVDYGVIADALESHEPPIIAELVEGDPVDGDPDVRHIHVLVEGVDVAVEASDE